MTSIVIKEFPSADAAADYLNDPENGVTDIVSVTPAAKGAVLSTFKITFQKKQEIDRRALAEKRELEEAEKRELEEAEKRELEEAEKRELEEAEKRELEEAEKRELEEAEKRELEEAEKHAWDTSEVYRSAREICYHAWTSSHRSVPVCRLNMSPCSKCAFCKEWISLNASEKNNWIAKAETKSAEEAARLARLPLENWIKRWNFYAQESSSRGPSARAHAIKSGNLLTLRTRQDLEFSEPELLLIEGVNAGFIDCKDKENYSECTVPGETVTYTIYRYKDVVANQQKKKELSDHIRKLSQELHNIQNNMFAKVKEALINKGLQLNKRWSPSDAERPLEPNTCYEETGLENYYVNNVFISIYAVALPWLKYHNKDLTQLDSMIHHFHQVALQTRKSFFYYPSKIYDWYEYNGASEHPSHISIITQYINAVNAINSIMPVILSVINTRWTPPPKDVEVFTGGIYAKANEGANLIISALKEAGCMDAAAAKKFKKEELSASIANCIAQIKVSLSKEDFVQAEQIKQKRLLLEQELNALM